MIGTKLILLPEVDSTNNYAANLLANQNLTPGTVILAEKQLNGRGQRGNSWISVSGGQFTATWFIDTSALTAQAAVVFNMAMALAVRESIQSYIEEPVLIKWPNDILIRDSKISGMLLEAQWKDGLMHSVLAGVGINLLSESDLPGATAFSDYLSQVPTPLDILPVLSAKMNEYFTMLLNKRSADIRERYHTYLWRLNEVQTVQRNDGTELIGKILGVNSDGNLLFETVDGVYTFRLQEVRFSY